MHPLIQILAQQTADREGIIFDIARDDADAQLAEDEKTFIKEYLPGKFQDICDNNASLDEIGAWLDLEFADWISDLNFERERK